MTLTPTERRIEAVLKTAVDRDRGIDTGWLLMRLHIANRHILKTHVNNMRRKGIAISGHKGGQREGGYFLVSNNANAKLKPARDKHPVRLEGAEPASAPRQH